MKRGKCNRFGEYTKITTILFTVFVIILSGCVYIGQNETKPGDTTNNSQGTSREDYIYSTAKVETINVTLESLPAKVHVIAKGHLPDGCTEINEIKTEREGNTFNINISTKRPRDAICTQAIENFTKKISLDVRGLKAGNYTVNVNGVNESFELPVDNAQLVITETDNGTNISLENGSIFFLKLKENPTTGYSWEFNLSQGLNKISGEYYPANQPKEAKHPLVGAGGIHLWEIKAVSEGSQQVRGIYKRPWEDETGKEEKFTLNIEVV